MRALTTLFAAGLALFLGLVVIYMFFGLHVRKTRHEVVHVKAVEPERRSIEVMTPVPRANEMASRDAQRANEAMLQENLREVASQVQSEMDRTRREMERNQREIRDEIKHNRILDLGGSGTRVRYGPDGEVSVTINGDPVSAHVAEAKRVGSWIAVGGAALLGLFAMGFIALLILIRSLRRREAPGGVAEMDELALGIHEKELAIAKRLDALENILFRAMPKGRAS